MTLHFRLRNLLLALPFLAVAGLSLAADPPAVKKPSAPQPKAKTPAKPRVLVTISKETTYITEPLRPDGYPDYVAALNQRFSRGVTPENNAAVPFWRAIGPRGLDKTCRERFFRALGIPSLPEKGDYFIGLDDYVKELSARKNPGVPFDHSQLDEHWAALDIAMKRPWSKQEFPMLAKWLTANEKPLALLIEASKRSRRYDPLIASSPEPTLAVLLHIWDQVPDGYYSLRSRTMGSSDYGVGETMVVHAMARLGEGRADEAWKELLAAHRFARVVGQGPTFRHAASACIVERDACAADQGLLRHAGLTAAQIARIRNDLAALPPMAPLADKIDLGDRYGDLDAVCSFARRGVGSVGPFLWMGGKFLGAAHWSRGRLGPGVACDEWLVRPGCPGAPETDPGRATAVACRVGGGLPETFAYRAGRDTETRGERGGCCPSEPSQVERGAF